MDKSFVKNIEFSKAVELAEIVGYQEGKVISVTFAQNDALSITLFAFAKGEGISTHAASGDAMVLILDGTAEITIGDQKLTASQGQMVVMPANIPHGLEAIEKFKMLLIVVRK
jgi:quercetin dioxygenase-like cupin family protein